MRTDLEEGRGATRNEANNQGNDKKQLAIAIFHKIMQNVARKDAKKCWIFNRSETCPKMIGGAPWNQTWLVNLKFISYRQKYWPISRFREILDPHFTSESFIHDSEANETKTDRKTIVAARREANTFSNEANNRGNTKGTKGNQSLSFLSESFILDSEPIRNEDQQEKDSCCTVRSNHNPKRSNKQGNNDYRQAILAKSVKIAMNWIFVLTCRRNRSETTNPVTVNTVAGQYCGRSKIKI